MSYRSDMCQTDSEPCDDLPTFSIRWPGALDRVDLCDRHMVAMSQGADPVKLDVTPLEGGQLVAVPLPGGDIAWRVER